MNSYRKIFIGLTALLAVMVIMPFSSRADIQHLDDVIIPHNLCVGQDCVNGESFGTDTLRFKENNLRIHFDDTSASSSFPKNDWRLTANDTANGGQSYFSIDDATAGTVPFKILAGSGNNAFYIDSSGQVGLGTSSPTTKLHVAGNAYISGNLELGSSRDLKEGIRPLDSVDALAALKGLRPVRYYYKSDPGEETLGFIAEELPPLVATNSGKTLNPMDVVAVLARVMQTQQETIQNLSDRLSALEGQLEASGN